jgi:hypothetical protein
MFEKSKSAITFKEFQTKLNIVNNFENDWGYFCDPDNYIVQNKKEPFNDIEKNIEKIKIVKPEKIEIEKYNPLPISKPISVASLIRKDVKYNYDYDNDNDNDNTKIYIVETILNYIGTIFVTFTVAYFMRTIIVKD